MIRHGATRRDRLLVAQPVDLDPDSPAVRAELSFDSGSPGIRELHLSLESPEGDVLARLTAPRPHWPLGTLQLEAIAAASSPEAVAEE